MYRPPSYLPWQRFFRKVFGTKQPILFYMGGKKLGNKKKRFKTKKTLRTSTKVCVPSLRFKIKWKNKEREEVILKTVDVFLKTIEKRIIIFRVVKMFKVFRFLNDPSSENNENGKMGSFKRFSSARRFSNTSENYFSSRLSYVFLEGTTLLTFWVVMLASLLHGIGATLLPSPCGERD